MLGEALRLIRVYHDLKQKQAAERLGVSTSYISEIEKGTKTPTLETIDRYSKAFDIPVSSIMFFSETLERGGPMDNARTFVAGKVLALMQFLEARSGRVHAE
ncbi:helix-turn-helix transcriptional regulator [Flavisphingomonas formosensis]|uniref:helix-turn-helix transcriptional regulator n=1 Tax=Flavisphingomonas formosensis TaxID=861534 RepID=UPI0012F8328F|nr:helix-turn-helix transcriptional regulator [Sphingomonas formosensis]